MNPIRAMTRSSSDKPIDAEVLIARITAFSRLAPLLYIIGNVNTAALAFTHYASAPRPLTLVVPVPLMIACAIRLIVWIRTPSLVFTEASARRRLTTTMFLTTLLGGAYAGWALSLYPYGGFAGRCHVAFFMSTTLIGTLFCLIHIRPAALVLTGIVGIPFMIRFATTGEPVLTAISINFLLVIVILIYVITLHDRGFRRQVEAEYRLVALNDENDRLANLDSLTGLPNRRSFFKALDHRCEARPESEFAIGLIDLDGFKPVNDVHGHAAGDRVLTEVGRRIVAVLGTTAVMARLGGDEFGLAVDTVAPGAIERLGKALCERIAEPIQVASGPVRVTASIGFAVRGNRALTRDKLMEQADYALYDAKDRRRGSGVIFCSRHETALRGESAIAQALRTADLETEMTLVFQPIVALGPERVVAYEVLARWRNPTLGNVAPSDFIPTAERIGMICGLTELLFRKAMETLAGWPASVNLSFNLSVHDLATDDLVERIARMIAASGIKTKRITLEITETALMHDFDTARRVLTALHDLGVAIALDDFGSGFSSLNYVHQLPLDEIKIDRTFVKDIVQSPACRNIVRTIIDLCRNLGLTCVVEGVETQEQMIVLQSLGCRTMQGYFFGRPAADVFARDTGRAAVAGVSEPRIDERFIAIAV